MVWHSFFLKENCNRHPHMDMPPEWGIANGSAFSLFSKAASEKEGTESGIVQKQPRQGVLDWC